MLSTPCWSSGSGHINLSKEKNRHEAQQKFESWNCRIRTRNTQSQPLVAILKTYQTMTTFLGIFKMFWFWRIIKCSNWGCMLHKNDEINSTKRYEWGGLKQNLHNKINIYKQILYKFLIQAWISSSSQNSSQTPALTISSSSSTLLIVRFTSIQFPTQFYGWKH